MSYTLKLADGTIIGSDGHVTSSGSNAGLPDGRAAVPRHNTVPIVEVPTNREAQQLVVAARKRLSDLPDVPRTMNTVSVVLAYSMFGLDDEEIALATGLTTSQVSNIRSTNAYVFMSEDVTRNIIAAESGDIRDLFVKHARTAASAVVDVMQHGKARDRLAAAADILDRGGFRPNDVVEHRHQLEGGLTIEIIRKDEQRVPTIDLIPEE